MRGCGYLVADTGTSIPLNSPAHGTRLVVRIGYYDAADSTGTVTAAGQATNVRFMAGLHYLYLVSHLPPSELRVRLSAQDNPICVTDVRIGRPVP